MKPVLLIGIRGIGMNSFPENVYNQRFPNNNEQS